MEGSGDEDEVSWQVARVAVLADSPGSAAAQALEEYIGRLKELQASGLTAQSAFVLLQTYVNGAVVHLQRGSHTSETWRHTFDMKVVLFMENLLACSLNNDRRTQLFLHLKMGGLRLGLRKCQTPCCLRRLVGAVPCRSWCRSGLQLCSTFL